MLRVALLVGLALVGCSPSPCHRTCTKLASCQVVPDEAQCEKDCDSPPNGGQPCSNEDAIATCIENATCDQLTSVTSQLQCPACQ